MGNTQKCLPHGYTYNVQHHPTKKRTLGISTISLVKFSRSCQAMLIKGYQNNNMWSSWKLKSGGEIIENDSRDFKKQISTDL